VLLRQTAAKQAAFDQYKQYYARYSNLETNPKLGIVSSSLTAAKVQSLFQFSRSGTCREMTEKYMKPEPESEWELGERLDQMLQDLRENKD